MNLFDYADSQEEDHNTVSVATEAARQGEPPQLSKSEHAEFMERYVLLKKELARLEKEKHDNPFREAARLDNIRCYNIQIKNLLPLLQ